MAPNWILTNRKLTLVNFKLIDFGYCCLYYQGTLPSYNSRVILLEGCVFANQDCDGNLKNLSSDDLVNKLFDRYGVDFIKYVKGNFIILIFDQSQVYIFNDHLGIKKFFYWLKDDNFAISPSLNNLKYLGLNLKINQSSLINFVLFNKYLNGHTLFQDIYYSLPASKWFLNDSLIREFYWSSRNLLNERNKYPLGVIEFREEMREIFATLFEILDEKQVAMSLTGGLDSRLLLGILRDFRVLPRCVTFGNPNSGDVVVAKKVANNFGLDYFNYFYRPDELSFCELANQIITNGNSLTSIFRAHRIYSFDKYISNEPGVKFFFGGYMGGELIRGLHLDGLITTKLLGEFWRSKSVSPQTIFENSLREKFIRSLSLPDDYSIDALREFIDPDIDRKLREFNYIFDAVIPLHHSQDLNYFSHHGVSVIPLFLDTDYLSLLFRSGNSFLEKDNFLNRFEDKVNIQKFHCELIDALDPQLGTINFNYGYNTKDLQRNRYYYASKRLFFKYVNKIKFENNFDYGEWFKDYLIVELNRNRNYLEEFFRIDEMIMTLKSRNSLLSESDFNIYANAVTIALNIKNMVDKND